jgi:hypothetical protein
MWAPRSIAPYHPFSEAQDPVAEQTAISAAPASSFIFIIDPFLTHGVGRFGAKAYIKNS